jgi:hypothetical protein
LRLTHLASSVRLLDLNDHLDLDQGVAGEGADADRGSDVAACVAEDGDE